MSQLLSGFQGNHAYIGNNSKQIICFSILNLIWIVISSITFRFSYAITLNLLGLVFRSRAFLKPEISRAYKSESLCLCRFPLYRSDKTGCNWYRQFLYLSGFPLCFSHFGSGGNFRFLFFSLICRSLSISPFSVFCAVLPAFTSIQIFTSPSHRLKRFSVFSLYRFHSLLYIYPRHNVPRTIYCWGSLAIGLTCFLFNLCLSALTAFPYPCRFWDCSSNLHLNFSIISLYMLFSLWMDFSSPNSPDTFYRSGFPSSRFHLNDHVGSLEMLHQEFSPAPFHLRDFCPARWTASIFLKLLLPSKSSLIYRSTLRSLEVFLFSSICYHALFILSIVILNFFEKIWHVWI